MKKNIVAGGAGFLGSHLCKRLLDAGEEVVCVDNFYTGKERNIASFLDNPRFSLLRHDVLEPFDAEADAIFNLACPASPAHYQSDPVYTTRTSVLGSINLLELARRNGCPILQASTSEVYGDPEVHPQPESYHGSVNPIGVRSCYDEGKRCAESLFFDYRRQHGVRVKVARIFNTYGPNMDPEDGRVVSNFIVQALRGEPIAIYGDGGQTRSFCYCDDLVGGLTAMMASDDAVTGPVNLGNPEEFTIMELAEKILAIAGKNANFIRRPLPQDDPRQRRPDIALAKTLLGWQPRIGLNEGLRRTVAYFRDLLAL